MATGSNPKSMPRGPALEAKRAVLGEVPHQALELLLLTR
jgi:hypothetical protein